MNKLREKLDKAHRGYLTPSNVTKECEQITDDFSVKFVEWCIENRPKHIIFMHKYTTTELLQIFKTQYYGKE